MTEQVDFTVNSFNKMIKAGIIKRGDKGLRIQLKNAHVRAGFNKRLRTETLEEHISGIIAHLQGGGEVPQLEVLPLAGGGVWIVDGHCRREGYTVVDASGEGDLWIDIKPFNGDELDALVHIGKSNSQLKLSPIELATLYQETRDLITKQKGKQATLEDVAARYNKTRQYVDQVLKLLTADATTTAMLEAGEVSAGLAVIAMRKHGSDAGAALAESLVEAKAQGKTKVTEKTLRGPTVPRNLLDDLYACARPLRSTLTPAHAAMVERFLRGEQVEGQIPVDVGVYARMVSVLAESERLKEVQAQNIQAKVDKAKQIEVPV